MNTPNKIFRHVHNEKGIILATVIIISMIMSIVAIGLISINASQGSTGQTVIDTIKAEQLSEGAFFYYHQLQMEGCPNPPCGTAGDCTTCPLPDEAPDGKTFSVTIVEPGTTGPNDVDTVQIIINY
ncbi:MAG: hypothetical protein KAR05_05145 [Candidatus Omnitrophica bacterium]|nr:hypothetical protein [Candidatus Omnitrophota bacterium]